MKRFASPAHHIEQNAPIGPVICFRPQALINPARWFARQFNPTPFYSVKANPNTNVLRALWAQGIRQFDVASLVEVQLITDLLPGAEMGFLHTVKSKEAISEAYFKHGCKIFALDAPSELDKILAATQNAKDLTLILRVAVKNSSAILALDEKFGMDGKEAITFLAALRPHANRLGVSFHVGSQAMKPESYAEALTHIAGITTSAAATVDIINIGGGFPALYPSFAEPPPLNVYKVCIDAGLKRHGLDTAEVWCEPGRALVSHVESLLTRVEHITDDAIFINDGIYGALSDAGEIGWRFPTRVFTAAQAPHTLSENTKDFIVYGPTCDSADKLHHKITLPKNISIGDYVEFGCVGAYGRVFSTRFNGFGAYDTIQLDDDPWPNLY